MSRRTVDLSAHIDRVTATGHPADFPVALRPLYYSGFGHGAGYVAKHHAVVREDTGDTLAIVSKRYRLLPHQLLLAVLHRASVQLDVGPVHRAVLVDRRGVRMRVLLQFPSLAQNVYEGADSVCPCIKVQNSYDKSLRTKMQAGSYRLPGTNIAVGGGGVFAERAITENAESISIEGTVWQLKKLLTEFDRIVQLYRAWAELRFEPRGLAPVLAALPTRAAEAIGHGILTSGVERVYSAYSIATNHATHRMLSVQGAFTTLERINESFQQQFPAVSRTLALVT